MSYDQFMEPRRRLGILTTLSFEGDYRLPLRALQGKLECIGYAESLDRIRTDAAWLAEQGLITVALDVTTLTARGHDVVKGLVVTPGVSRPAPGEVADLQRLLVSAGIAAAYDALRG